MNKKATSCIIAFIFIISLFTMQTNAIGSEVSYDDISYVLNGNNVTVTGTAKSGMRNTDVSFLVLAPKENTEGILPSDVYACSQEKTRLRGRFSYTFKFGNKYGDYKVYVNEKGVSTPTILTITNKPESSVDPTVALSSDNFGHIYYNGDDVKVNINLTGTPREAADLDVSLKVYETYVDQNNNSVNSNLLFEKSYEKITDMAGKANINADITTEMQDKFGVFGVVCSVKDKWSDKTATASTRISRVNAVRGGSNINPFMGVNQHVVSDWKDANNVRGFYGSGRDKNGEVGKDADKFYSLFADCGYRYQREELHWNVFDKGKAIWDKDGNATNVYGEYKLQDNQKAYFEMMKEKGLKPYIIFGPENLNYLRNDNGTPDDTTDDVYPRPYINREYIEAFGKYCYEAVKQTIEYTDKYEILNEYNHSFNRFIDSKNYNYTETDYKEHVLLMKAAYENAHKAAREAGKEITVYGGAVAFIRWNQSLSGRYTFDDGTLSEGPNDPALEWIDGLLKNGGGQYMDELSFHIYTNSYTPEEYAGNKAIVVNDIKKILQQNGFGDMGVYVSETGYATSVNSKGNYVNNEEEQAKYMLRDLALLYNKVSGINWYCGIDTPNTSSYEHALGQIKMHNTFTFYTDESKTEKKSWNVEIPYEAKRAYIALSNWNTLLSGADLVNQYRPTSTAYNYVFETNDGKKVHMLWSSAATSETIAISCGTSLVDMYDMYGNKTVVNCVDGMCQVELTGEPVYLSEEMYTVKFIDQSGNVIKKLTDNVSSVKAEIDIDTDMLGITGAVAVIAAYDTNGGLVYADTAQTDANGHVEINTDTENAREVRIYLWKDLSTLVPVAKYSSLKK